MPIAVGGGQQHRGKLAEIGRIGTGSAIAVERSRETVRIDRQQIVIETHLLAE